MTNNQENVTGPAVALLEEVITKDAKQGVRRKQCIHRIFEACSCRWKTGGGEYHMSDQICFTLRRILVVSAITYENRRGDGDTEPK